MGKPRYGGSYANPLNYISRNMYNVAGHAARHLPYNPFKRTVKLPVAGGNRKGIKDRQKQTHSYTGTNTVDYEYRRRRSGMKRRRGGSHNATLGSRFPKARRVSVGKYHKYGVVLTRESKFLVADPECVYVGHGTPSSISYEMVIFAIVRSLFNTSGMVFSNWEDVIPTDRLFTIRWVINKNAANDTTIPTTMLVGDSYRALANRCYADLVASITDAEALANITFRQVYLISDDSTGNITYTGEINLTSYIVEYKYLSFLKVKNVTLAEVPTSDPGDEDLTTNVYNSPLVGRTYHQHKWMNGFQQLKTRAGGAGNPGTMHAGNETGAIIQGAAQLSGTVSSFNMFNKPPRAFQLGVKKTAAIKLNPGEIRHDKVAWTCSMQLNTMIQKLQQQVALGSFGSGIKSFGTASMLALERAVDIPLPLSTNPDVTVAIQIDYTVSVCGKPQQTPCPPLMWIP